MKQNVLIIEENVAIRFLLFTVLGSKYEVSAHANCYQAVKDLKDKNVQVVIVNIEDQQSPNFGFLQHLYSSSFYSEIPVIVLSNNPSGKLRGLCLDLGAEAFFQKPFDPLKLMECIKDILYISANYRKTNTELEMNHQNGRMVQTN